MSFAVAAESYDRFMGRYSTQLAAQLADLAGVAAGQRVLDVGCGTGALTGELARRVGVDQVSAVDPSETFVEAMRVRHPGVGVARASAEDLPFPDGAFDATLAQLVVHFLTDPPRGISEMARVTRPGGVVAACVWDHESGRSPLGAFWGAARELDPDVDDESRLPGARAGHLGELLRGAGLSAVEETTVTAVVEIESFDEWWEPFSLGVGPAGAYATSLEPGALEAIRRRCLELLPPTPFTLSAVAWATRGVV